MKTLKSIIVAFFLGTLFSTSANAQTPSCSYMVQNSHNCTVNVTVDYYSASSCSGPPCVSTTTTIPSNQSATFSCGSCGNLCNVEVTVNWFGSAAGVPSSATSVDINNQGPINNTVSGFGTCPSAPFGITWGPNNCDITN